MSCVLVEYFWWSFVDVGFKDCFMGGVRGRVLGALAMSTRVGEVCVVGSFSCSFVHASIGITWETNPTWYHTGMETFVSIWDHLVAFGSILMHLFYASSSMRERVGRKLGMVW